MKEFERIQEYTHNYNETKFPFLLASWWDLCSSHLKLLEVSHISKIQAHLHLV